MSIYRYRYLGVDIAKLSQVVPGTLIAGNIAPQIYYDIQALPGSLADLSEQMLAQGWVFDSTDPVTTPSSQSATDTVARLSILDTGVLVAKRSVINLIGATIVDVPGSDQVNVSTVPLARTITAGNGLTGGGDLSANRTLTVQASGDGSIAVGGSGISVGALATDVQHGDRGGGALHAQVTQSVDGFMIASDKSKLDGITPGATNTPLTSSTPTAETPGATGAVGTAITAARADHVHALATGTPSSIGTANAAGTSSSVPRLDHVHAHGAQTDGTLHAAVIAAGASGFMTGSDKSKLDGIASGATNSPQSNAAPQNVNAAAATAGVSTSVSRDDHTHQVDASVAPSSVGTANAIGTSDSLARADHVHSHGAQTVGTLHAAATQSVAGFLSTTDKTKLDGIATSATNTPLAATTSPDIDNTAAVVGTGSTAARDDHTHRVTVGTPVAVGTANANGTGTALALATHVHDHGSQTSGTLHAAATGSVAGFMSAADKTSFDAHLPTSGEKSALAGSYGAPGSGNKYVTATDPSILPPGQVLEVAVSGRAYTSIATALAAITDATSAKPYCIRVHPGVYTEAPFTLKAYVSIVGVGAWFDQVIQTSNDSADFITTAAGACVQRVSLIGPTGAGFAAINSTHTGNTPCILDKVVIRKGYYGINQHPASFGTLHCHEVVNQYAGTAMNQFMRVTNGNIVAILCAFMSGPSASVTTGFYVDGATSSMALFSCSFDNAGSTDGLFVDNGADVHATACTFTDGTNAIHIGASGASTVSVSANYIAPTFTKGVWIESSSATFSHIGGATYSSWVVASGTTISGIVSDPAGAYVLGGLNLVTGGSVFPLGAFANAYATTGLVSGGTLAKGTGLDVDIAAGAAFVFNGTSMVQVSWLPTTHTLTASIDKQYIYVDSAGVFHHASVEPDLTLNLLLGEAATNGTDVLALSEHAPTIPQNILNQSRYADEVIGPVSVSGGTVTKHASPSLQFKVDSATFWIYNNRHTAAASADPATFTLWYRNGSGGWTKVTGQTSLDVTKYDDGSGTLANLTAGYYKGDLAFLMHNASGTEIHVVYAQEQQALSTNVLNNPVAPDLLTGDGLRLARMVVQQGGNDILTIYDQRPKIGQAASGTTAVTVHSQLSGLSADDHCFSEDTELLTTEGWVNYTQIERQHTMAMSFNKETERIEPSMVIGKYVYDTFDELIRFRGNGTEILVTPEHKMVYRTTDPKRKPGWTWQETTADKLSKMSSAVQIPMAGVGSTVEYPRPDDYLKMLAWVVSEGNACDPKKSGYGYRIYQGRGDKSDRINAILQRLGVHNGHVGEQDQRGRKVGDTKYETQVVMDVFYVPSEYAKNTIRVDLTTSKIPARHLLGLSQRQFRVFLGELMLGDGSVRSRGATAENKVERIDRWVTTGETTCSMAYASKNEALIDWLQEGCALNGLRTKKGRTKKGLFYLNVLNLRTQRGLKSDRVKYDGNVWCVSVMKNQTLVLRRNGRVFIAGNTQYQLRSEKGNASGYAGLDGSAKVAATNLSLASAAPTQVSVGSGAAGTSTNIARQDHGHDISVGSPVAIGTANNAGAATSLVRSDHVHDHGAQTAATHHAVATTIANGFMSSADKSKLDAVPAGSDTNIQYNDGGTLAGSAELTFDKINNSVKIGPATVLPNNPLAMAGSVNATFQIAAQNTNAGTRASTDYVATADNGSDTTNYIDLGINSSTYADAAYTATGPDDGYLYASDGHLAIGTAAATKTLKFHTGGTLAANVRATVDDSGFDLAASKSFRVDGTLWGLQRTVRLATTGSIAASGTPIIDSVQTVLGDRILRKDEGANTNGIYVVAAGAWSLAPDWATGTVIAEQEILVSEGTVNGHNGFRVATTGAITVGATTVTFAQYGPSTAVPVNVTKATAAVGTSTSWARSDHKHDVTTAAVGTVGTANAEGTATSLARSDHTHDHGTQTVGTMHAVVISGGANGFMSGTDKSKLDGVASGATNTPLSSTTPSAVDASAGTIGAASTAAKADHTHAVNVATAVAVGSANAAGSSNSLARADHVHDHGSQTVGTMHAVAIAGGANGFMSGSDKTKLDASSQSTEKFGNTNVSSTSTTRYLTPGFDGTNVAGTSAIQYKSPVAGTAKNLYIVHNNPAGNGGTITYTLRINGVATALTVGVPSTSASGVDNVHTVAIAVGDLIDIQVTKAGSIGTSPTNVCASFQIQA